MKHHLRSILLIGAVVSPVAASAHALLDHAVPGVGAVVSASPAELTLSFTQRVVPALSRVSLATKGGQAIPVAKATIDAADPTMLHAHVTRPLPPGAYVVTWRVVSVDTHPTSGSFTFTIAP